PSDRSSGIRDSKRNAEDVGCMAPDISYPTVLFNLLDGTFRHFLPVAVALVGGKPFTGPIAKIPNRSDQQCARLGFRAHIERLASRLAVCLGRHLPFEPSLFLSGGLRRCREFGNRVETERAVEPPPIEEAMPNRDGLARARHFFIELAASSGLFLRQSEKVTVGNHPLLLHCSP